MNSEKYLKAGINLDRLLSRWYLHSLYKFSVKHTPYFRYISVNGKCMSSPFWFFVCQTFRVYVATSLISIFENSVVASFMSSVLSLRLSIGAGSLNVPSA
ncbi:hypothetical protein FQZ97_1067710 [compost metagenome]